MLSYSPSAGTHTIATAVPRPLLTGERADVWLAQLPRGDETLNGTVGRDLAGDQVAGIGDDHWEVHHARVIAVLPDAIVLQALDPAAALANAEGQTALIRRAGPEGLAEWSGTVTNGDQLFGLDYGAMAAVHAAPQATVVVQLEPGGGAGRLFQRRRSPRVPVALAPTRVMSLAAGPAIATIEAQLTDVSANGAGLVTETPLPGGATVSLEFTLPGESEPFVVRGRVVEPAAPAEEEPPASSADGQPPLPRFRRGVEFIGTAANREAIRLAAVVTRLLTQES